ncbi:MAG: zinc transporter ZupT [Clostridia bacterium]|nr:zinc transporter ZupT [Clostridia bacterium]
MLDKSNILLAFGLTIFAGLSTGIGSLIAFLAKRTNTKFLSVALGFSGGVMIYVSFVEIFAEAKASLTHALGAVAGGWATAAAFFGGILLIALIDKLVPRLENPHEARCIEEIDHPPDKLVADTKKLMNTGIYAAIAIAVHNFPEGIATFTSTLQSPALGVAIATAILIHNIPEGIAVSVPIYFATGSKKKAFWYSFLSGAAEPIGALIAFLVLMPILNDVIFGVLFASVAGIMVFIALDELLPASREYGEPHLSLYGLLSGMAVMAVSLLLFIQ